MSDPRSKPKPNPRSAEMLSLLSVDCSYAVQEPRLFQAISEVTDDAVAVLYASAAKPSPRILSQIRRLLAYADQNQSSIARCEIDAGSGRPPHPRPGLRSALEHLRSSNASMLIVDDISRLGRDPGQVESFIESIRSCGATLHLVAANLVVAPDDESELARAVLSLRLAFFKAERDMIQRRMQAGRK